MATKDLLSADLEEKQVLRCAQNDSRGVMTAAV
jgi:hypothetical protein